MVLVRLRACSGFAMLMVLLVPGLLAFVFGWLAFRSPRHGRLSLDHHPGADLRADAGVLPQQFRLRRQQRPDRLQGHSRLQRAGAVGRAPRCSRISCAALVIGFVICRAIVTSKLGKVLVAIRDAESAHALPRLSRRDTTSCSCSRCRPAWRASPARSTCRRSASSTRASSRRRTPSRR